MSRLFEYEDGWIIRDTGFDRESEYTKASAYALCNGYLGNRGTLEEIEATSGHLVGTYINGIYDAPGGVLREREFVNVQHWASIRLQVDGDPLDLTTGRVLSFKRWMDLRDAVLHREVRWQSPQGKVIGLASERFVSLAQIHFGFVRWRLEVEDDCNIVIASGIDAEVLNVRTDDHFAESSHDRDEDVIYLETTTKEMGYRIGVACDDHLAFAQGIEIGKQVVTKDSAYIANEYSADLSGGDVAEITKVASIHTSRDDAPDGVRERCTSTLREVAATGYETAKTRHTHRWAELWNESDMVIEGDDEAQIGVRFAIYHLLNSAPYHSSEISYPARSLSGQDHWGSVHWDTEIFIVPFFTYSLPEVARNMLVYRHRTLNGARRKAARLGYRGAYYAWESHENGDEKCPSYVFMNDRTGRLMRNFFWDRQIHISADIVYAIWQYYAVTDDVEFLVDYGAEIAAEVARFHESRVFYDVTKEEYIVTDVMGPDEYHESVDNNAYTNALIKDAFAKALRMLELVRAADPEGHAALVQKIGLDQSEVEQWEEVHDRLFVPAPDPATSVIEQFSGYLDLEEIEVEEAYSRRIKPDEYLGGIGGIVDRTQVIKQADVIMLLYLMRDQFSSEVKRANWEYYDPRTEHGSSLSPMAHALVAADAGLDEQAYKLFRHTALMDLDPQYFSGYFNHGVHPCSLEGAWLAVVNGFAGITPGEDGVHWREPNMPSHWEKLDFGLKWHGHAIRFTYAEGAFSAALETADEGVQVPFFIGERQEVLTPGSEITR